MMTVNCLHCERCGFIRPIRFQFLSAERSLGTRIECAHCSQLAFTLVSPARIYCDICDDIRPGELEVVKGRSSSYSLAAVITCGTCHDGKAMLYGSTSDVPAKSSS